MIIPIENTQIKFNIKALAVDTNILLWTFYENTIYIHSYQRDIYPNFLENAIENNKCHIYTTVYNICELFNVIEKNEYELYINNHSLLPEEFNKKQYREIKEEREKLQTIFKLLYTQISNCMEIVEYDINEDIIDEYNEKYHEHRYDIFDFTLLKFCKENNINYILTDDSDFASDKEYIKDINIMTANRNIINLN